MDKKDLNLQAPKWFVLRTCPRREKIVQQRVSLEGVETYLPKSFLKREWSDRVKLVELPLVKSMVFVFCPQLKLRTLEVIKGVVEIMTEGGEYLELEPSSIEALRKLSGIAQGGRFVDERIVDDMMKIPWKKRDREVVRLDENYYYLHIPEIDRTIYIEINR